MVEIVVSIFLIFLVFIFYIKWVKPAKTMKGYVKFLRSRGYKVCEMPFSPMKHHMFTSIQKGN